MIAVAQTGAGIASIFANAATIAVVRGPFEGIRMPARSSAGGQLGGLLLSR